MSVLVGRCRRARLLAATCRRLRAINALSGAAAVVDAGRRQAGVGRRAKLLGGRRAVALSGEDRLSEVCGPAALGNIQYLHQSDSCFAAVAR